MLTIEVLPTKFQACFLEVVDIVRPVGISRSRILCLVDW